MLNLKKKLLKAKIHSTSHHMEICFLQKTLLLCGAELEPIINLMQKMLQDLLIQFMIENLQWQHTVKVVLLFQLTLVMLKIFLMFTSRLTTVIMSAHMLDIMIPSWKINSIFTLMTIKKFMLLHSKKTSQELLLQQLKNLTLLKDIHLLVGIHKVITETIVLGLTLN